MVKRMRLHSIIVTLTALLLFSAALGVDNEVLKIVPADSLFCLKVNNFEYTLNQMDSFLAGLLPSPMPLQMALRMQLATLFGNPQLDGVDMKGSFALFAQSPDGQLSDKMLTFIVPVTDFKQFVSASPNLSKVDANGIVTIQNQGGLLTQAGKFAIIKSPASYDELTEMQKSVKVMESKGLLSILDAKESEQAASAPEWIYVNVPQVNKVFGPHIAAGLEEMRTQLSQMPAGVPMMMNPNDIVNMYSGMINTFMNQTKYVSVSLVPTQNVMTISTIISSQPGTDMAKLFTLPSSAAGKDLTGYLKDRAFMNISGRGLGKLNSETTDFFLKIFGNKMSPENVDKMRNMEGDFGNALSGNIVASYMLEPNSRPPFSARIVAEIKDKDKLNNAWDQMEETFNSGVINDFYKSMGLPLALQMTLKRGIETYKDVPIDSVKFIFKTSDSNSQEAMFIKSMYGEGIDGRFAVVNGLWVCSYGGNADAVVKNLIDEVKSGSAPATPKEIKDAMAMLSSSKNADFFATFNIVRVLGMLPAMMMPVPFAGMSMPSNSNLIIAGKIDNGSLRIDIAVPKTHVMEIMQMIMQMQSQQPTTSSTPGTTEKKTDANN